MQTLGEQVPECRLFKKVQMQGGAVPAGRQEEARSETYLVVRCNDERRSQRRRWAFFNSRLGGADPRARLKSVVRKSPRLAGVLQWVLDPAFTPKHLIEGWVRRRGGYVLNIGSGSRSLGPRVVNLDIEDSAHVHVINQSDRMPFRDASFDGALLEYVLEHVEDYRSFLEDVVRILRPGGALLVTVPFRQNYHACPQDFWRFTHEGLEALLREVGTSRIRVAVYGGPTSAWIDATKEFFATILSLGSPLLYAVWSQLLIIPFIPLRYLDVILRRWPVAKYTAFSFIAEAERPGAAEEGEISRSVEEKLRETLEAPDGYALRWEGQRVWVEPEVLIPASQSVYRGSA